MFKTILRLSRPYSILLATLTYTLGAGIAHYLGRVINVASFWLGLLVILSLLIATFLFTGYFRLLLMPLEQSETPRQREQFRIILLQVAFAALTLSAIAILTALEKNLLNLSTEILLVLTTLVLIAYAVPPLRLSDVGYGDLIQAITLGTLLPAMAFLLQYGQIHRLLSFITIPFTLLALAYLMVCNFPTYSTDMKLGRHTLLTRVTWQNAIPIHHFLVLVAFMLFAAGPLLGYPWKLIWPVFMAFPFAVIQIIWLQNVANGGRALWNFLIALTSATFGLAIYLLALTFWIH